VRDEKHELRTDYRNRSKTVTRRLGWDNLRPGERFMGVEKGQGLKKGEHVTRLHAATCTDNRAEPLNAITPADVVREGFPCKTPEWFVAMFCAANRCGPKSIVNRVEFEHGTANEKDT